MGWLHQIILDGTDVTDYVYDYTVIDARDSEDADPATIVFLSGITSLGVLKHYNTITIKRGTDTPTDKFIFNGYITNIKQDSGLIVCDLRPPHWNLQTQNITETFDSSSSEAGDIASIWETIATGEDSEITVSSQSSTEYPALTYFVCRGESRWKKSQELRKILRWQSYYKPSDDTYYLEPEGFNSYNTTFEIGKNVFNNPLWKYDFENIINDIKVEGAVSYGRTQESFNGDTVEKVFTLSFYPTDTEVYTPTVSQANLQSFGVVDSTETYDYTVEQEDKTLTFVSAPGSGTDNVIVNYSYFFPRPVRNKDAISIANYGKRQKEIKYETVITVSDAKEQANAILSVFSLPFKSTTLLAQVKDDLFPGYRIRVIDSVNNEDTNLTVNKIIYSFRNPYDELYVGDYYFRIKDLVFDILSEIERLNTVGRTNPEIITDVVGLDKQLTAHYTKETWQASPESGVLYWNDDNQGTWNDYNWGDGTEETSTMVYRNHSTLTFYDDFSTTNYIDTDNTTATVDTNNRQVNF